MEFQEKQAVLVVLFYRVEGCQNRLIWAANVAGKLRRNGNLLHVGISLGHVSHDKEAKGTPRIDILPFDYSAWNGRKVGFSPIFPESQAPRGSEADGSFRVLVEKFMWMPIQPEVMTQIQNQIASSDDNKQDSNHAASVRFIGVSYPSGLQMVLDAVLAATPSSLRSIFSVKENQGLVDFLKDLRESFNSRSAQCAQITCAVILNVVQMGMDVHGQKHMKGEFICNLKEKLNTHGRALHPGDLYSVLREAKGTDELPLFHEVCREDSTVSLYGTLLDSSENIVLVSPGNSADSWVHGA